MMTDRCQLREEWLGMAVQNCQLVCFSRLYMVTWNVATRHPEEELAGMLGFGTSGKQKIQERLPDFFVIG